MFCAALTTAQFGSAFAQRAKLTRSGYEGLDTDGAITEARIMHGRLAGWRMWLKRLILRRVWLSKPIHAISIEPHPP
jgi:hypothetical protein